MMGMQNTVSGNHNTLSIWASNTMLRWFCKKLMSIIPLFHYSIIPIRFSLTCWAFVVSCFSFDAFAAEPNYLSPSSLAMTKDGKTLYVACQTAGEVMVFDTTTEKVTARHALTNVHQFALSPDEQRLYLTGGTSHGTLQEVDLKTGKALRSFSAGHTPMSPLVTQDGKRLFYCNRHARTDQPDIHELDITTGKILRSAKAIREPVKLCLSKDEQTLWAFNHLPLMEANRSNVFTSVSVYDAKTFRQKAKLDLPSGSFAIRDAVMSPDGKYCFVTHTIGRFTVPTTHLDRGWINTSAISVLAVEKCAYLNTALLDDTTRGAANPWGVTITPDGKWLCITASGIHELLVIPVADFLKRLAACANPKEVVNNLSFLYGAKTRLPLEKCLGPRAVVASGDRVYSANRFSDNLAVVQMWDDGPGGVVPLPLVEKPKEPDLVRHGERIFNDATLCYQQWQSCASCHPDTRSDGTNWDLLNDGIGNPKQSRSMLYSHRTSPVMITGIRESAEIAVEKGFTMIQFQSVTPFYLDTVNAYIKSLEPELSPYRNPDGSLTAAAVRGKVIFEGKAECIKCHTPPYYGDKKPYVLGLGSDNERTRAFCTPILIEVWRTAPYMYDGRALSMETVITTDNSNNKHGNTKNLSKKEVRDLGEYVNSL
jgi:DNA-binding beta-propeller fold protein YncE/mono/diheme cytochrome c family protein